MMWTEIYMPKLGGLAFLRDKYENEYDKEQLALALLLKSKGKKRDSKDGRDLREILKDPNLDK